MASVTAAFVHTAGMTLYAFPVKTHGGTLVSLADWTTYRVACTPSSAPNAGRYVFTANDIYSQYFIFSGASQPANWNAREAGLQIDIDKTADTIIASGGVTVTVVSPVSADGNIESPIVIADDYLAANDRAFEWTFDAVAGVTVGTATCYFGLKYKTYSVIVEGTVSDNLDGTWTLSFDVLKTDTEDLVPGYYQWSVELRDAGGTEITSIRGSQKVELVEKQT